MFSTKEFNPDATLTLLCRICIQADTEDGAEDLQGVSELAETSPEVTLPDELADHCHRASFSDTAKRLQGLWTLIVEILVKIANRKDFTHTLATNIDFIRLLQSSLDR